MAGANNNNGWQEVPIKKKADDSGWQEVPLKSAEPESSVDDVLAEYAIPFLQSVGSTASEGLGSAFQTVDKYVGAPFRSGVQQAARGNIGQVLPAVGKQFGEDPTKAPSMKDIYVEHGLSGEDKYDTGLILNPYTRETLKLSPAGIAGGATEMVVDPLNAVPFGKIAKGITKGAEISMKGIGKAAEYATPKIGKLVSRVPEETTMAYMANPKRIKETAKKYSHEQLKDMLDSVVINNRDQLEQAREAKARLQESLKQKLRDKKFDIQKGVDSPQIMDEIHASMENQKKILSDLSEQAENILAQSGQTYRRKDVLKVMDNIGREAARVVVGDQITDAMKRFYALRERVAGLKKEIPAEVMRDIFRQVRQDTNWKTGAGEFNTDLNSMRKQFSERWSNVIKGDIPGYKEVMEQAAPMSKSLESMSQYFGTPEKTSATLQSIRKGGSDVANLKENVLRQNAETFQNQNILKALEKYETDRNILDRMSRGQDLGPELFPQETAELGKATTQQDVLEKIYKPLRRLNPDTDKNLNVVKRYGFPNASLADRRAVEVASKLSGVDFPQMFTDKNIYHAFDKDATAGSRNVNALGKIAGYVADRYGGRILRGGIEIGQGMKGGIDAVLNYLQNDPKFRATYGKILEKGAQNGLRGMLLYHHLLMNNDPNYRAHFAEGQQ